MKATVTECKKGNIDLRDYNVTRCMKLRQNYEVTYMGKVMTLTPAQLLNSIVEKSNPQKSMYGKDYCLWSYKWVPDVKQKSKEEPEDE